MKVKIKSNLFKLFLITALLVATPVFASEFSFDIQNKNISVEEQFKIDLNINTNKESINAVGGKIIFPADLLDLSEVREENSIVNFWVEKPIFKDGEVVFSGITPAGYISDKSLILSLVFKAKKEGKAFIKIENASALKNDGKGTKSTLKTSDLQLNISGVTNTPNNKIAEIMDQEAPEEFLPEISKDPNLLDNKWFLVFVAEDKGSGTDKYEVKESRYNIFDFSRWVEAKSPYILTDQELKSNVFVKAIDKKGNVRTMKLSPRNPPPWYANIENWFIIALVGIVTLTYFFFSKRLKK